MDPTLVLEDLFNIVPEFDPVYVDYLIRNCVVCFHEGGHSSGVTMKLESDQGCSEFAIQHSVVVDGILVKTYNDLSKRVDEGACALALLLAPRFCTFRSVERSRKDNGYDYLLVDGPVDDDLPFNSSGTSTRLEVSGIQIESLHNTVAKRVSTKRAVFGKFQITSGLICVIEFGVPQSRVVRYGNSA